MTIGLLDNGRKKRLDMVINLLSESTKTGGVQQPTTRYDGKYDAVGRNY